LADSRPEARAAGLLTHPNIVVVFDAGEEEGVFYITMETGEVRSLQACSTGRQLFPLPRVMRLMEQVCSALDFAHQRNVVHRDIKPANLMLTADDTVKITDFGTAKILQFARHRPRTNGKSIIHVARAGEGKPVDGRSDIFSLGVILYELMTGEEAISRARILRRSSTKSSTKTRSRRARLTPRFIPDSPQLLRTLWRRSQRRDSKVAKNCWTP